MQTHTTQEEFSKTASRMAQELAEQVGEENPGEALTLGAERTGVDCAQTV